MFQLKQALNYKKRKKEKNHKVSRFWLCPPKQETLGVETTWTQPQGARPAWPLSVQCSPGTTESTAWQAGWAALLGDLKVRSTRGGVRRQSTASTRPSCLHTLCSGVCSATPLLLANDVMRSMAPGRRGFWSLLQVCLLVFYMCKIQPLKTQRYRALQRKSRLSITKVHPDREKGKRPVLHFKSIIF